MLSADLIAFPGLNCRIIEVRIVKLDLDDFDLRILRLDLLKDLRAVMERNSKVADLPLFLKG